MTLAWIAQRLGMGTKSRLTHLLYGQNRKEQRGTRTGQYQYLRTDPCFLGEELRELTSRRKGDAGKVQIAWRLRRETTMTLRWIAHQLQMGTWTYVANCLAQKRKNDEKKRKCQ